mgnify:CR=1 FL=1
MLTPNQKQNRFTNSIGKDSQKVKNSKVAKVQKAIIITLHKLKEPLTRRKISELTSVEICTLCAQLSKLERSKLVIRAYSAKCPTTGIKVIHYGLQSWEGKKWN